MMKNLALLTCLSAASLWGQMSGFSKEDLLKYTRLNPFERFEDGRPKVPDEWLERLGIATSTMAWGPLRSAGFMNQYSSGWKILHPSSKRSIGSRDLFQKILVDEERHVDWLEAQLEMIDQMGIGVYLSQQMGEEEGGDAGT